MVSELSFLIELLLNHDLPKATKDLLAQRIKEVESNLTSHSVTYKPTAVVQVPNPTKQAPSTLAAMARHDGTIVSIPVIPEVPVPVEQIAQTPATAQAMTARNQTIADAISGKIDKTSGRPKKW